MANAWNELVWGIGNYGEQNNCTVIASGSSSISSVGSFDVQTEQRIEIVGFALTANLGNATENIIDNGWGAQLWGYGAWGIKGDVLLQGQQLNTVINDVTFSISAEVDVTGSALQTFTGQAASRIDADVTTTGSALQTFTGNEGTEGNAIVIPTGATATFTSGQATIDPTYLIGEGWGRDTWGNLAWGVNYSVIAAGANGLSATVVTGNEDAFTDYTQEITVSFGLNTQVNSVDIKAGANIFVNVTEHTINTNIEPVTIEGTALVEPTGTGFNVNIGVTEAGLLTEVPVTGSEIRVYSGNEDTSGNATVSVTGSSATTAAGQASYIAGFDVTGSSLQTLNGAVSITGTGKVIPTGTGLTVNTITPNIIAWAEVDTGTSVVWTPVDIAA